MSGRDSMALKLQLFRVPSGVAVMGQECNYKLHIIKLGRKGVKINVIIIILLESVT
jgi:hypothetical protein